MTRPPPISPLFPHPPLSRSPPRGPPRLFLECLPTTAPPRAVSGSPPPPDTPPRGSSREERHIHQTPALLQPVSPHKAIHCAGAPPGHATPLAHRAGPPQ